MISSSHPLSGLVSLHPSAPSDRISPPHHHHLASISTSGHNAIAAASSSPTAVCLVRSGTTTCDSLSHLPPSSFCSDERCRPAPPTGGHPQVPLRRLPRAPPPPPPSCSAASPKSESPQTFSSSPNPNPRRRLLTGAVCRPDPHRTTFSNLGAGWICPDAAASSSLTSGRRCSTFTSRFYHCLRRR